MALRIQGLVKSFGGELAVDQVDLDVADGEIHALLGPNGSGKSTLIGCLSGRLAADAGSLSIGEVITRRFTPRTAFAAGIAVIYQHLSLIPSLSIADNIFLGEEKRAKFGRIDRADQARQAQELLARLGVELNPTMQVGRLSPGQQQLVEIAKALRRDPRLLVLDEPTAALGEAEAKALGRLLRNLRESGLAVLYVTHLLGEVFDIADRVTVLRDGHVVLAESTTDVSPAEIIEAIAPRRSVGRTRGTSDSDGGNPVLNLEEFGADGTGPIGLHLAAGEIVAVFGLLGSGRSELLEGLFGVRGATQGTAYVEGSVMKPRSPVSALKRGLALVPAERGRQGIFKSMSAQDNVLVPYVSAFGRFVRKPQKERSEFAKTAEMLRLKPANPAAQAWTFSGGNQQKLVVGRWLTQASRAKILLLDEPTQGIDVGARQDMYDLVRNFVRRPGLRSAVLFTSSDPDEVEALADRAYVLVRGRIAAEFQGDEISGTRLLALAHSATGT